MKVNVYIDSIVGNAAGLIGSATAFVVAEKASGYKGAPAITRALASLGGGSMKRGLVGLGGIGVGSNTIAAYAFRKWVIAGYRKKLDGGRDGRALMKKLEKLPYSPGLKEEIRCELENEVAKEGKNGAQEE